MSVNMKQIGVNLKKELHAANCLQGNIEEKLKERTLQQINAYLHMCLMKLEKDHKMTMLLSKNLSHDGSLVQYHSKIMQIQQKQKL